jgi:predicted secreted Zn-dependent protease
VKRRKNILTIGCLCLFLSGIARAEPTINLQTAYYHIQGESARNLRSSLNSVRPTGQFHDAYTKWHVTWTYSWRQIDGNFALEKPKVAVTIEMTLPQWTAPATADKRLVEHWQTYVQALRKHENGHAIIGTQAARDIEKKLLALPRVPTAEALKELAESTCQQVLTEARAKEKKFDKQTDHGMKDGARFP